MNHSPLAIWCAALTAILVGAAMITDLRWRRIPNSLTFSAFGIALVLRVAFQGWVGLVLGVGGALVASVLLLLLHGGKGIGMGDLKLAAAVGAIVGPPLAVVTVLCSAVAGGVLAIAWMLRSGGLLAQLLQTFLIGLPFFKKMGKSSPETVSPAIETMPYGLAIGIGSLMTLAVSWWTGNENWFLSFAGIAGNL